MSVMGTASSAFPVRLQTHVWNPGGRRRALLLHGLGSDGTSWWRIASALARDGWMVAAPDLRGHGRSPSADDHSFAALTADASILGAEWDLVVGHSLGGAIAVCLLDPAQPDHSRTARAVLIDPVLHIPDALHEGMRDAVRADCGEIDPDELRIRHPKWHERDVQRKVQGARLLTPDVVDGVFDDNRPWDLTASVQRLQVPVAVLIPGEADERLANTAREAARDSARNLVHDGSHSWLASANVAQVAPSTSAEPGRDATTVDEQALVDAVGRDAPTGYVSQHAMAAIEANPFVTFKMIAGAGHSIHRDEPDAVLAAIYGMGVE